MGIEQWDWKEALVVFVETLVVWLKDLGAEGNGDRDTGEKGLTDIGVQ